MPNVNNKILTLEEVALDAAVKDLGPGSTVTTEEKLVLFTLCLPVNSANVVELKSLLDSQEFLAAADSGTSTGRTSVGGDTSFTPPFNIFTTFSRLLSCSICNKLNITVLDENIDDSPSTNDFIQKNQKMYEIEFLRPTFSPFSSTKNRANNTLNCVMVKASNV